MASAGSPPYSCQPARYPESKKDRYVEVIEKNISYVEFRLGDNIITIPWNRVLKLKEERLDDK